MLYSIFLFNIFLQKIFYKKMSGPASDPEWNGAGDFDTSFSAFPDSEGQDGRLRVRRSGRDGLGTTAFCEGFGGLYRMMVMIPPMHPKIATLIIKPPR